MAEREKTVYIKAYNATKTDRNGKPVEKTFTEEAWNNLHDPNWTREKTAKPAALKTPKAPAKKLAAKAPVKKAVKKLVARKAAKPKALKGKRK